MRKLEECNFIVVLMMDNNSDNFECILSGFGMFYCVNFILVMERNERESGDEFDD